MECPPQSVRRLDMLFYTLERQPAGLLAEPRATFWHRLPFNNKMYFFHGKIKESRKHMPQTLPIPFMLFFKRLYILFYFYVYILFSHWTKLDCQMYCQMYVHMDITTLSMWTNSITVQSMPTPPQQWPPRPAE